MISISDELLTVLKLANKTPKDIDLPKCLDKIGYPSRWNIKIEVDKIFTKYSQFSIVAVQTYFYDYDGQADSSYSEANYVLHPEQYVNGIQLTKAVVKDVNKSSPRNGKGKDWYYETSSSTIEWELQKLWVKDKE